MRPGKVTMYPGRRGVRDRPERQACPGVAGCPGPLPSAARRAAVLPGSLPAARRGSENGLNTTEVREWVKAQGIEVKDRGRVPAELV